MLSQLAGELQLLEMMCVVCVVVEVERPVQQQEPLGPRTPPAPQPATNPRVSAFAVVQPTAKAAPCLRSA